MHRPRVLATLFLPLVVLAGPRPAQSRTLEWARQTPRVTGPYKGVLVVPCGIAQSYGFHDEESTEDEWTDFLRSQPPNKEDPEVYPTPGPSPFRGATEEELEGVFADEPHRDKRWGAVIDWKGWHGANVGVAIRQYSGTAEPLVRFPLDEDEAVAHLGPEISDAHVLVQLCRVLDAVEFGGVPPPAVVNLSFGRLAREADRKDAASCSQDHLACQITITLKQLGEAVGLRGEVPTIVAAAGNHGEWLFPALVATVLATGLPDPMASKQAGEIRETWETPPPTENRLALLPAGALCLSYAGHHWTAPSGSSFSTALLSAGLLASVGAARQMLLEPSSVEGNGRIHLIASRAAPGVTWGHTLIRRIAEAQLACLADGNPPPIPTDLSSSFVDDLGLPSLARLVADEHRPAPEPTPCVSCRDVRVPPQVSEVVPLTAEPTARVSRKSGGGLVIDLSTPWPLEDDTQILEVYLHQGQRFHALAVPQVLSAGVALRLYLASSVLTAEAQPSLVFVLSRPGNDKDGWDTFWNSVPIVTVPKLDPVYLKSTIE